jgi:hypothetical protein
VSVNVFQMGNNTVDCCHTNNYSKSKDKKTKERKREKEKTERLRNLLFCVKVVT